MHQAILSNLSNEFHFINAFFFYFCKQTFSFAFSKEIHWYSRARFVEILIEIIVERTLIFTVKNTVNKVFQILALRSARVGGMGRGRSQS